MHKLSKLLLGEMITHTIVSVLWMWRIGVVSYHISSGGAFKKSIK